MCEAGSPPLDVFNDFNGSLLNHFHALSVRVFAQIAARSNDQIDTIDSTFDRLLRIIHVGTDMGQDLGLYMVRHKLA